MADITQYIIDAGTQHYYPGAGEYLNASPLVTTTGGNGLNVSGKLKPDVIIIAMIIIMIIIIICCCYRAMTSSRDLSCGLAKKGWVLYITKGCGYCSQQIRTLGGDYQNLIVCGNENTGKNSSDLKCEDISGFPYWYNPHTKEERLGAQNYYELKQMVNGLGN